MATIAVRRSGVLSAIFGLIASAAAFADTETTYSFSWYVGPTVSDFPAPMTLREGDGGFSYSGFVSADGSDLRVKDSGGNLLPHEIERWNTSGSSIVWVKMPSLSSSASVTLSWGDVDAPTASGGVWDDDFLHVFHFGDDAKKNSSSWNYTTTQTTASRVDGVVGQGLTCVGDKGIGANKITAAGLNISEKMGGSSAFTFSCWVKDGNSNIQSYICRLGKSKQFCVLYNYKAMTVELYGLGDSFRNASPIILPDTGWHHVAYTYDGTKLLRYLDGVLYGTFNISATIASFAETDHAIYVGATSGNNNPMEGSIDEFRLEKVVRDANWIKAVAATCEIGHDHDDVYTMAFPEYDGVETLTDFPLMVTLSDRLPGLPNAMKSAIYDQYRVHFFTADGTTELPFEVELSSDAGGSAATYWVRMPSFAQGSSLRVQTTPTPWRGSAAADGGVNTAVWASDSGAFQHVYHLQADTLRRDSAPEGKNLDVPGKTGWTNFAAVVDGPTAHYGAAHFGTNVAMRGLLTGGAPITNLYTISFWARKDADDFANPTECYLLQLRALNSVGDSSQRAVLTGYHGDGNTFKLWKSSTNSSSPLITIPDVDWHHYAFVCDGVALKGYRDGEQAFVSNTPFDLDLPDPTNRNLSLGGTAGSPNASTFKGDIDEFRIEIEPRSADWVKACYRTQFARRLNVTRLTAPAFGDVVSSDASVPGTLTFSADLVCKLSSSVTLHYGDSDGGANVADWTGSMSLGTIDDGRISATVSGLAADQGVYARFRAVTAYGEAWSPVISGHSLTDISSYSCLRITVTNIAHGVTLRDFPLCVRITADMNPPATADTLRFTGPNGTPFAHEVEAWDAEGESVVWVRVPEVSRGTKVKMFWGKPFMAATAPVASVWNGDYEGVYHMADGADSSSVGCDFTNDVNAAVGVMGVCRQFSGSGAAMATASHIMDGLAGPFTISGWVKGTNLSRQQYLVLKTLGGKQIQFGVLFGFDVANQLRFYMDPVLANTDSSGLRSAVRSIFSPIALPDEGAWHHFAYSYDGGRFCAYLDGELVRQTPICLSPGAVRPHVQSGMLMLGRSPGGSDRFEGCLDELRLELVERSAEWVKACYDDQRGAFASIRHFSPRTVFSLR